MIFEKLCYLEGPTRRIGAIKSWNVELQTVDWIVRWQCLSCRGRRWRLRWLLVSLQLCHTLEEVVNLRVHC